MKVGGRRGEGGGSARCGRARGTAAAAVAGGGGAAWGILI